MAQELTPTLCCEAVSCSGGKLGSALTEDEAPRWGILSVMAWEKGKQNAQVSVIMSIPNSSGFLRWRDLTGGFSLLARSRFAAGRIEMRQARNRKFILQSLFVLVVLVVFCGCGGAPGGSPPSPPPPPPQPQPQPQPQHYIILHTFEGKEDGARPWGLIRDQAGNLYGTTSEGGNLSCPDDTNGCGTIFKVDYSGVFTTLHVFAGSPGDGANPQPGLVLDSAGNLYGGTFFGGAHQSGIVFKLDSSGNETVLHHFSGGANIAPNIGVRDASGNLYGTTGFNGNLQKCSHDCGTVFRLDITGNLTTLHTFNGSDGDEPSGSLIDDAAFNLYGTTAYGGNKSGCVHPLGCGTVFKLDPEGNFTMLYAFGAPEKEGNVPSGPLVLDHAGSLYGTTIGGGINMGGTVFKLDVTGVLTSLHSFISAPGGEVGNDPGGQNPEGGLLALSNIFYGTADAGGVTEGGVVFALDQSGKETVLDSLIQADGWGPIGPIVSDASGKNLYSTATAGADLSCQSPVGCGVLFQIQLQ